MTAQEITDQLQDGALADSFPMRSMELTAAWSSAGVGIETVEPILRFMEEHPDIDFGMPGPLVHFVERFHGKGYEGKLVESIERRPTPLTVWMLNRIINGTKSLDLRQQLIATMERAMLNPRADQNTQQRANGFIKRLS
jgi:hypothetical protein